MTDKSRTVAGIKIPDTTPPDVGFGRLESPRKAKEKYPLGAAMARRAVSPPVRKRWRLYRSQQVNQLSTPECVTHTGKHWEKSLPTYTRTGLTPHELYVKCKAIDPWPNEDGTSADALLQVYRGLGKVASWHWYDGAQKDAIQWLLTKGPMWWGAMWSEPMFRPDAHGLIDTSGNLQYGHETLAIGVDTVAGLAEIVNSWGNARFGIQGRGWITIPELFRVTDACGDLIGVEETGA